MLPVYVRWVQTYLHCVARLALSAAHFWPILLRFVRVLPVYPKLRLGADLMLRF